MTNLHFRQAILTRYLAPTNFKGSRVRAVAEAGSITVSWDHALNGQENHAAVAQKLASKYGWRGKWYGGVIPGGDHVFVNCDERMEMGPAFEIADREKRSALDYDLSQAGAS